ncbi:MAG: methyltransferase domain-containing protein [Acidimicrobiales bacterium]
MWDPDQYLRFASYRRRPVDDLLARVLTTDAELIVDLGCGPGNLTDALHDRWPEAHIDAIDRDRAMIDRARADNGGDHVRYIEHDIAGWTPDRPVDVVFSNAALHWLPAHDKLMVSALEWLRPGGTLAVQVPGNTAAPSHTVVAELRRSVRWRDKVGAGADDHVAVEQPEVYASRLAAAGAEVDVWESTYVHLLNGPDPVVQWLAGSTLRPVLAALDADEQQPFLDELTDRLRPHYPPDSSGHTAFRFRRIFVVARKPPLDESAG